MSADAWLVNRVVSLMTEMRVTPPDKSNREDLEDRASGIIAAVRAFDVADKIEVRRVGLDGSDVALATIPVPERWRAYETRKFLDELLVPGTSVPDICRGLLIAVEHLAMTALPE